jgi:Uma2 family endonuclease
MTALRQDDYYFTPEQYLVAERLSDVKHEYVAGKVYAMAGTSAAHDRIANNIIAEMRNRLRGKRCEVFSSNLRVRIRLPGRAEFYYYPDALVDCSRLPNHAIYAESPTVIFEVMSAETERVDQGEKLANYRTLPSLRVYVLLNQNNPAVTVYRLTGGEWQMEFYGSIDCVLELPEIESRLALAEIYDRVLGELPGG